MFWPDVIDLKLFYASRLGQVVRNIICRTMSGFWASADGEAVLGIGFTHPYLEDLSGTPERVIALMPTAQGALRWMPTGKNLTFLADEGDIPLPDACIDRVLLVHALENTEQQRHMMSEIWRILTPGGRLLVIVPNRSGMWARVASSPFAHGSPFSASQLRAVLRDNYFSYSGSQHALFIPPTQNELVLRNYRIYEWIGRRFFPAFSGVLLMQGEKQIYAPSKQISPTRMRKKTYLSASQPVMTKHYSRSI